MIDSIFYVIILIMSVVVHEVAHGYTAYLLGDDTARLSGRLTLNPIKHLDLFGSVVLPLLLVLSQTGFVIGWAKPVPYNPNNIKSGKKGILMVALSGILANIFLVLFFGLLIRILPTIGFSVFDVYGNISPFYKISTLIVVVNLVLAIFNLIPIPPLDGSKILYYFIPVKYRNIENFFERWGLLLLVFFIIFVWDLLTPLISYFFTLITGFSL